MDVGGPAAGQCEGRACRDSGAAWGRARLKAGKPQVEASHVAEGASIYASVTTARRTHLPCPS